MTEIRSAQAADLEKLKTWDRHIPADALEKVIRDGRVLVLEEDGVFAGWLRWGLFWDDVPFVNLLFILEPWRGRGLGQMLMEHWEREMLGRGYQTLMTSTASNEYAQHFYEKLGYRAAGGFFPPNDPYELILLKEL